VSGHAVPFYCPYCGEEDLVPEVGAGTGQGHGHWSCRSCRRGFRLSLTALAVAPPARPEPASAPSAPPNSAPPVSPAPPVPDP
jgi:hypothetical protein